MPISPKAILAVFLILLTGCSQTCKKQDNEDKKPAAPLVTPTAPSQQKVDAITKEQATSVAAHVQAAKEENTKQPASNTTTAIDKSLSTALSGLPAPSSEQVASAKAPIADQVAGNTEDADKKWKEAVSTMTSLQTRLEEAKLQVEKEKADSKKAMQAFVEQAAKDRDSAIAAAKDEERKIALQAKEELIRMLNYGGLLLLGAFGVATFFGGVGSVRSGGWILLLMGILAFGLAQTVGDWWFKWACVVSISAIILSCAYVALKADKASSAKRALQPSVDLFDKYYEQASPEEKARMDAQVFTPLGQAMNNADRATVHMLRAEDSLKKGN
jgi:chemotaxis protein histidine kinase CheA